MAEYIKWEAAYKDFEKCNSENPKWTPSRVKTLIARQKAADVAPVRHGRWIDMRESSKDVPRCKCTECGYVIIGLEKNYCPNCGARMDGEDQKC